MRLWHQALIPFLDRSRLLSQHRECAALRGMGWGRKHATVDYVFTHDPAYLVAYHSLVMDEMIRRGYNISKEWLDPFYRGVKLGMQKDWVHMRQLDDLMQHYDVDSHFTIFPEHNDLYLQTCIDLLYQKQAEIDWKKVKTELNLSPEV